MSSPLEPADESETLRRVRAENIRANQQASQRERLIHARRIMRENSAMGIDHDRPQSGYFDAHPPRNAYPAHKGCEPVTEQPSEPQEAPSEPAE